MTGKKWGIAFISIVLVLLILLGSVTVIIDPYFHYHKPLDTLEYPLYNQRYQNNGILRHFSYDAIITGTSMTENFRTSELDALFGTTSVKIPFSGGSYKEINDRLSEAVKYNKNIKMIVRGLDYERILDDAEAMRLETYPTYLYDDLLLNDVSYIFNKSVLIDGTYKVLDFTASGGKAPTFDEYSNWMEGRVFGKKAVDTTYQRVKKTEEVSIFTKEDNERIKENITQNIISLAKANPNIDYYLFFAPYSIYYFDFLNQQGILNLQLKAEKKVIQMLLEYENVYLFSFFDEFDMICDLDNYKDIYHYGEKVNTQILVWMHNREHQITKENYEDYCKVVSEFYLNYDYDSLFEK